MNELGSLDWWQARYPPSDKRLRRLARTFHDSYHHLLLHAPEHSCCALTDKNGWLREITVSTLDMQRAVAGAKTWCRNTFCDREYGHVYATIATRLPKWVKKFRRRIFALRTFEALCEGRYEHGDTNFLALKLNRSPNSIRRDYSDFFLFVGTLALDDNEWKRAMQEGEEA